MGNLQTSMWPSPLNVALLLVPAQYLLKTLGLQKDDVVLLVLTLPFLMSLGIGSYLIICSASLLYFLCLKDDSW
jgi:hypothetical protein